MNRLDDMLMRYGEVCTQKQAGMILNVVPRTIARMMKEGRLRRVATGVDVRSIYEYIESGGRYGERMRRTTERTRENRLSEGAFFAAARSGRWVPGR